GHALGVAWRWTPPGLAYAAMTAAPEVAARALVGLASQACVATALALVLLERLLSHGIVVGGGREAGGRGAAAARPLPAGASPSRVMSWLSPVQRRELRLLGRDRNFLVQTFLMPLLIVGMQVYLGSRSLKVASVDPSSALAAGFAVAAYSLMFSAFQIVNAEGQALWLLFTLPQRLEKVLLEKVKMWAGVALLYPVAVIGFYGGMHGV